MSRTVKPVQPKEPGHLRFYSCGPTVYSYAHIGNFRTFLTADLVVRVAEAIGWQVSYVSNITDVGHLTQDDVADASGEDKMQKALQSKEGESFANVWDLARFYAKAFEEDWQRLNLRKPTVRPRATEHMREQIVAVEQLIRDGHAYETPTGVYFSVESFEEYGKLSGNRDRDSLQVAVRDVVQDDNKKNPADFALWKKDDKHLMQWFSPWGWGFPGWHIECSVMAQKYLGDHVDLHGGGEDLKFPHHECEIAQSESATGQSFCDHWLHVTFLQVEGEKMSKSKGNFFTVRDLLEQGFDPLALRLALIAVPYNKPHNFTIQSLKDAQGHIERFRELERRIASADGPGDDAGLAEQLEKLADECLDALANDLNTSVAVAKTLEGVKAVMKLTKMNSTQAEAASEFLEKTNALLGVVKSEVVDSEDEPEAAAVVEGRAIEDWIEERQAAKMAKDYAAADLVRDKLLAAGIELRDTPQGVEWIRR